MTAEHYKVRKIYVLSLLTAVYFFYLVDRQAILISQELIKIEFGLSDTNLGFLTGALYGVAYAMAGLPLGFAVDRVNRKNLLAAIVALWSGFTALSGLATSYLQLGLLRMGTAAAEAGGSPAALSILSDLFPPHRRNMISSIFYAGAGMGSIVSFLVGGYVAAHYGWRVVFILFGLPGLLLAVLIYATCREPVRTDLPPEDAVRTGFVQGIWSTFRQPGLPLLYLASALYMLSVAGVGVWTVPFLMRTYHLDIAQVGLVSAIGPGLCGVLGSVAFGALSDRARRRFPWGPLVAVGLGALVNLAFGLVTLLSGDWIWTIVGMCGMGATMTIQAGPTNAAISEIARPNSRGMAFALYAVLANVVGSGMGPLVVGVLSDRLGAGESALRTAMLMVLLVQVLAAATYFLAAKAVVAKHEQR